MSLGQQQIAIETCVGLSAKPSTMHSKVMQGDFSRHVRRFDRIGANGYGQCPSIVRQGFAQGPGKEPKTIVFGHLGQDAGSSGRNRPKADT
jgi:hypothetical protein